MTAIRVSGAKSRQAATGPMSAVSHSDAPSRTAEEGALSLLHRDGRDRAAGRAALVDR